MAAPSNLELRTRLIGILRKEIGVRETGGPNTGPRVMEYQRATSEKGTGWPWCAAFLCWGIREWTRDKDVPPALGLTPATLDAWLPRTALAYGFEAWGREKGLLLFRPGTTDIHTADIFTLSAVSHVGIVITDDTALKVIHTIEGNTDGNGGREGIEVAKRERKVSGVRKFIRLLS